MRVPGGFPSNVNDKFRRCSSSQLGSMVPLAQYLSGHALANRLAGEHVVPGAKYTCPSRNVTRYSSVPNSTISCVISVSR